MDASRLYSAAGSPPQPTVRLPLRAYYAIQALSMLAVREGKAATCTEMARTNGIPVAYLRLILRDLLQSRLVRSVRGRGGGYILARSPADLTIAMIARSVGVAVAFEGERPQLPEVADDVARRLGELRAGLNAVVDHVLSSVTLAQVVDGRLPRLTALLRD